MPTLKKQSDSSLSPLLNKIDIKKHIDIVDAWNENNQAITSLRELTQSALQVGSSQPTEFWSKSAHRLQKEKNVSLHFDLYNDLGRILWRRGEIQQAQKIWELILQLLKSAFHLDDKTKSHLQAAIYHNMADLMTQQGGAIRAAQLYNRSLQLKSTLDDKVGQTATLHAMAEQQRLSGELEKAETLYKQALKNSIETEDLRAHVAILHNLALCKAEAGQLKEAMQFYRKSLPLKEQLGGPQSKAATLATMAWIASQQGDHEQQQQLNLEAAQLFAGIHAWPELVTVLGNLGADDSQKESLIYLAQALWLALHIGASLDAIVSLSYALFQHLGAEAEASPWLAALALYLVQAHAEYHPQEEELLKPGQEMLSACAKERSIPMENLSQWMQKQELHLPKKLYKRVYNTIESIVKDQEWLFDRRLFQTKALLEALQIQS